MDEDLLEEVVNLVEYPTVFSGSFKRRIFKLAGGSIDYFNERTSALFSCQRIQEAIASIFCSSEEW